MSSNLAKEKLRLFPVVENDNTVRWVQRLPLADGESRVQPVEHDLLYEELERRYGGGFAQWVIDGLKK
jgi:hypothetical protein